MAAARNPMINTVIFSSIAVVISLACINVAPNIAGIDSKKLYLAANSLFKPNINPIEIVAPDLDIPGAMEQA